MTITTYVSPFQDEEEDEEDERKGSGPPARRPYWAGRRPYWGPPRRGRFRGPPMMMPPEMMDGGFRGSRQPRFYRRFYRPRGYYDDGYQGPPPMRGGGRGRGRGRGRGGYRGGRRANNRSESDEARREETQEEGGKAEKREEGAASKEEGGKTEKKTVSSLDLWRSAVWNSLEFMGIPIPVNVNRISMA